jgi:hypothetical protein
LSNILAQFNFPITADIAYKAEATDVNYFGLQRSDPFTLQKASGDYTIYYGTGNNSGSLKKPVIIVEGFDANNEYSGVNVYNILNRGLFHAFVGVFTNKLLSDLLVKTPTKA